MPIIAAVAFRFADMVLFDFIGFGFCGWGISDGCPVWSDSSTVEDSGVNE